MSKTECFKIQVLKTNHHVTVQDAQPIRTILCEPTQFMKEPKSILADPFLFADNDWLYLFYEEKGLFHPAHIAMKKTQNTLDSVVQIFTPATASSPRVE